MAKKPDYIIIHHTAVSLAKNPDQWQATNNFHKNKVWGYTANKTPIRTPVSSTGFYGGYNYEISAAGAIKQFRKDGEPTVAQYQQNMNDGRAISICLDGNFDIEDPTPAQRLSLKQLVQAKMALYKIPAANVWPHRKLAIKTCPGKRIPNDLIGYILAGNSEPPEWAKASVAKAISAGILTADIAAKTDWEKPLTVAEVEQAFHAAHIFEQIQGTITLPRLLVALDRLGVFNS